MLILYVFTLSLQSVILNQLLFRGFAHRLDSYYLFHNVLQAMVFLDKSRHCHIRHKTAEHRPPLMTFRSAGGNLLPATPFNLNQIVCSYSGINDLFNVKILTTYWFGGQEMEVRTNKQTLLLLKDYNVVQESLFWVLDVRSCLS